MGVTPARQELFNYNETPSSRCSSSRDPYKGPAFSRQGSPAPAARPSAAAAAAARAA
jgi:hypothetical protein